MRKTVNLINRYFTDKVITIPEVDNVFAIRSSDKKSGYVILFITYNESALHPLTFERKFKTLNSLKRKVRHILHTYFDIPKDVVVFDFKCDIGFNNKHHDKMKL